jgi:hypothetical protein
VQNVSNAPADPNPESAMAMDDMDDMGEKNMFIAVHKKKQTKTTKLVINYMFLSFLWVKLHFRKETAW